MAGFSARRLLIAAVGAGMTLSITTSVVVAARATVTPFSWEVTYAYDGQLPSECLSDQLTATYGPVTEFGYGEVVENDSGVTVRGRDGMTYSFDLSDGRHVEGTAAGTFTSVERGGVFVYNEEIHEPRTIYSADGRIVGRVMIHALAHVVYDVSTDSVRASIDRYFFTCS